MKFWYLLRSAALTVSSPGEVLGRVNDLLVPQIPLHMFVTCLVLVIDPAGPPCYCGACGCVETFISGGGLEARFRSATGRSLAAEAIFAGAAGGDAGLVRVDGARAWRSLGAGIRPIIA